MDKNYMLSADSLFHCLGHFSKLCTPEKATIEASGRTAAEINAMLARPGSKFFADSVAEVVEAILRNAVKTDNVDGKVMVHAIFQQPVGLTGILSEDELTDSMRAGIREDKRGPYTVRTVPCAAMNPTREAHLVMDATTHSVITLFPGCYAPAIPGEGWSASPFWSTHYFIRLT